MKIGKDVVVGLIYQSKLESGTVIDQAVQEEPLEYVHGYYHILSGLETALEGKDLGDSFTVTLPPEEAYGEYNDALVQRVSTEELQEVDKIEVGMRFLAETEEGEIPVEVTEIDGDDVVVDGNHTFAGQTLTFDIEVVSLRPATEQEIAHGHAHSEGNESENCG